MAGQAESGDLAQMLALFDAPAQPPVPAVPDTPLQVRDSEEIRAQIIELLSSGKFLREIARMPGMPSTQAIRNWRKADPDFDKEIEAARLEGTDAIFESCLDIADDGTNDYIDVDGVRKVDIDHIQRSKLRVDIRMRMAEKMNPKKYGPKVDMNHGGQVGNPIRLIAANMTQEESTQLYSEMLKVGR